MSSITLVALGAFFGVIMAPHIYTPKLVTHKDIQAYLSFTSTYIFGAFSHWNISIWFCIEHGSSCVSMTLGFFCVYVMMISVLPTNLLYHMYLTAKKASKRASMMNLGLCLKWHVQRYGWWRMRSRHLKRSQSSSTWKSMNYDKLRYSLLECVQFHCWWATRFHCQWYISL